VAVALTLGCGSLMGIGCTPAQTPSSATPESSAEVRPQDDRTWTSRKSTDLDASQQAQQQRGMAARDALFGRLVDRLTRTISSTGPTAAIAVCRDAAPEMAREVGAEHFVAIGRTSFKLRNPANKVPPWARDWVDQRVDQPQFASATDGTLAMLLPIKLKQECLMCHGAVDQMDTQVVAALERLYPDDAATGFAEGDLRGWFWIEVPADTSDAPSVR